MPPRKSRPPAAHAKTRHLMAALCLVGLAGALLAACGWWYLETRTPPVAAERQAPAFTLPDHRGRQVSLDSLLADGPAVLIFYRGHW